ncbi:MAG: DUF2490 domain-containing protein [bacterium]|nr:DUF2490 domain-containing protein [bacterium]
MNDFTFTRPIAGKWASEINIGNTYSNSPVNKNPFAYVTQYMARYWMHYYLNARWKLSLFSAYFYNYDVPEVGQVLAPEIRIAPQAVYYIHKRGYTLSTVSRVEIRFKNMEKKGYTDSYRYFQNLKYLHPINSKIIRQGVWYSIAVEEAFINLPSGNGTKMNFDRNRFNLGAGYCFTEGLLIELCYVNEYVPRAGNNEMYHHISTSIVFNNFRSNIKKRFPTRFGTTKPDE